MNEPMMSLTYESKESVRRFAPAGETARPDPAASERRLAGGGRPAPGAPAPAAA
jgi:hypothetical protein